MFKKAKRIWLKGLSKEMNTQARFTAQISVPKGAQLFVTGATFYKVYFDGELIHHGPSPTATGYARVDVVDLPRRGGVTTLSIEVAGYASNSYAAVNQPSYLIAEVVVGDEVAQCMVSVHAEPTFERLRYILGGDRPSQTAHLTVSPHQIHGGRLETQ